MPYYKVTERVIGTAERTRSGFIYMEKQDDDFAIEQAQSGSIVFDEDKVDINAELTLYDIEEIKVN